MGWDIGGIGWSVGWLVGWLAGWRYIAGWEIYHSYFFVLGNMIYVWVSPEEPSEKCQKRFWERFYRAGFILRNSRQSREVGFHDITDLAVKTNTIVARGAPNLVVVSAPGRQVRARCVGVCCASRMTGMRRVMGAYASPWVSPHRLCVCTVRHISSRWGWFCPQDASWRRPRLDRRGTCFIPEIQICAEAQWHLRLVNKPAASPGAQIDLPNATQQMTGWASPRDAPPLSTCCGGIVNSLARPRTAPPRSRMPAPLRRHPHLGHTPTPAGTVPVLFSRLRKGGWGLGFGATGRNTLHAEVNF